MNENSLNGVFTKRFPKNSNPQTKSKFITQWPPHGAVSRGLLLQRFEGHADTLTVVEQEAGELVHHDPFWKLLLLFNALSFDA